MTCNLFEAFEEIKRRYSVLAVPFDEDDLTVEHPGHVGTKRRITAVLYAHGLRGFRIEEHGGHISVEPWRETELARLSSPSGEE